MQTESISTSTVDPCEPDFRYVHGRLSNLKMRIENLISVAQGMEATTQARTTTVLTIALIFAPMALVASVFSMGGMFAVGEIHFWAYWVVAVPLTIILIVILWFWKQLIAWRGGTKFRSKVWTTHAV